MQPAKVKKGQKVQGGIFYRVVGGKKLFIWLDIRNPEGEEQPRHSLWGAPFFRLSEYYTVGTDVLAKIDKESKVLTINQYTGEYTENKIMKALGYTFKRAGYSVRHKDILKTADISKAFKGYKLKFVPKNRN